MREKNNIDELPEDLRVVELKQGGEWKRVKMMDLKIGDLFRMFNPDGEPVLWDGCGEFIAGGQPYIDETTAGRWGVMTYSCDLIEKFLRENGVTKYD